MPGMKRIDSPDKASEAIKSPQPPRISVSLKSRKRLLLSQRHGHPSQNVPLDESNHVSGDSINRNLLSTQESFFTAADTRSLLLDGTAQGTTTTTTTTLQGSLLTAPSLHGLQGNHSNRSQKSLFSRITTMNNVTEASHVPSSSQQLQSHASTSTNIMNEQIIPIVAETTTMTTMATPPPSLFGAVMSRSTMNTDHMLESTFGDNTHSHTSLHKAMEDEASVDHHLQDVESRDESHFQSNKSSKACPLPFSPEKDHSSKPNSNSSFITPNRKRKRQEDTLNNHDTPRQSILKDSGASHGVSKTVNWDVQQQLPQDPVTPKFKSPKSSASPFSKHSPGGVGLWKVLQSLKTQDPILTDPIHQIKMTELNKNEKVTVDAQSEAEEEEDWVEISLSPSVDDPTKQTSEKVVKPQIFDWTLKRSMTLDCYPCLPGKTIPNQCPMMIRNEAQVDFLATQIFSHADISGISTTFSQDVMACAHWKASLMYWQHPALHPLPMSVLEQGASALLERTSSSTNTTKESKGPYPQSVCQIFVDAIQGPAHTLQKQFRLSGQGSLGGLGSAYCTPEDSTDISISRMYIHRVREWKECFQSMFMKWMDQVVHHKESTNCPLSNVYFYSLCPGQVVLFKGIIKSNCKNPMPLITLSSTTAETRHTLLCMGIQLRVLGETHSTLDILSLNMVRDLENKTKKTATTRGTLQSLLDGSKEGSKLGDHRQANIEHALKRSAPMYILGTKDCMRYYEYYLNTLGGQLPHTPFLSGNTHKRMCDVPLLICRSLGPCRHTTLKSLSTLLRFGDESTPVKHASYEFRGPIMPCAVRDLLSATVHGLVVDSKNDPMVSKKTYKGENENNIGSHYFVSHLQCHQGEEVKEPAKELSKSNRMGMAGLLLANDSLDEFKYDTSILSCKRGEYLSTVVWDITRSSSIMCKRDKIGPHY